MANIKLELEPFNVPDTVEVTPFEGVTKEGITRISLSEIPSDALAELCEKFRNQVFEKAGVRDPRYTGVRSNILDN